MATEKRVLWITDSEEVADTLTQFGETATVWEKKLTSLVLEPKEDIEYRVLIPLPLLGVGLSFLKENKFVTLAVVSPKRPPIPWWARATEVYFPFFLEKVYLITYNEDADITKFLRKKG
jgi:hypothetical protein